MRVCVLIPLLLPACLLAQTPTIASDSFDAVKPRALGPTTMGGRIEDIAVYEKEPRIFYVGTAAGGLWKTENMGVTLRPIFERESTIAIGAVAVSQSNPDIVWVGTGERDSRNSSSWGDGVYKSTDGGKTWTNVGLKETKQISRIVIDPRNNDVVYVGALGHLWGANPERGVFKTTDGGKTWTKVLDGGDKAGAVDLTMDPKNPNTLLCSMWERLRFPYNFISGGEGSGLYRTTNGGKTWKKITKGLPEGPLGRIGLNYFRKDPKVVIATVEHKDGGTFRSTDGGESWTKVNSLNPRPFYFSMPRQDPQDENRIYLGAVSLHYTDDMGKTFRTMPYRVHADHHAMWIDPNNSNHFIVGVDGGVYQTFDRGKTVQHVNYIPIGQFYAVTFDNRKPYYVYGGLQDNGSWGGPTQTLHGGVAFFDWYGLGGGDGFHVQVDPNDWRFVYSESQGGAIQRINQETGESRSIRPRPAQGERVRYNWSSPIFISPHNSKTLYFGGNKLFKSVDQGDNWRAVSPDLTLNDPSKQQPGKGSVTPENTGAEVYNTIITISESPRKQGVLWVGTDDGLVQLSQDDGVSWTNVTPNIPDLPKFTWCSRVTASRFSDGRCYASFDGHRNNDYKPYVYVTEDFGKTWAKLNAGLPEDHSCYVIKEAITNPDLLILGTEMGMYFSFDRGQKWLRYNANGFPNVRTDDVSIQPRDMDLLVATHGRSLWVIPFSGLDQLTQEAMKQDVALFRPAPCYLLGRVTGAEWDGDQVFLSPNTQPSATIFYYLKAPVSGDVKLTITDVVGNSLAELDGTNKAGLNSVTWNARGRGRAVRGGDYRVTLKAGGKEYLTALRIEDLAGGTVTGRQPANEVSDDDPGKDKEGNGGGG